MNFQITTHDGEQTVGEIVEADANELWLKADGSWPPETFDWAEIRKIERKDQTDGI